MNNLDAPRSLHQLLAAWEAATSGTGVLPPPAYSGPDVQLTNLVEHTGEVQPGSCFVARVRERSDGHPYIPQAVAAGATVIFGQRPRAEVEGLPQAEDELPLYFQVADTAEANAWLAGAWYGYPSREMMVIGVTGTDGKTSTIAMLYEVLLAAGLSVGMLTTIKAVFGPGQEEPTGLHVTTPEAPQVQRYLRRMANAGVTHCLLEATSHGLAQHRVTAVAFDLALVTNITHEHIDYHGSWQAYFDAKARLFHMALETILPPHPEMAAGTQLDPAETDLSTPQTVAILNRDDRSYAGLAELCGDQALTYGIDYPAHVMASAITYGAQETSFTLQLPENRLVPIRTPLVGKFNIYNMLCAAAGAHVLGATDAAIKSGLEALQGISGRMQRIDRGQSFLALVDFAHTPNALERAIEAARAMVAERGGRVIAIFGSAGKRDIEKRRMMAETSAALADVTILTAEDPRTEALDDILEMMAAGARSRGGVEGVNFFRVPDRGEALYFGVSLAQPEDIVIACGKGHEQSMCFGTTEYPWDDREALTAALDAFLAGQPMPNLGLPTFGG